MYFVKKARIIFKESKASFILVNANDAPESTIKAQTTVLHMEVVRKALLTLTLTLTLTPNPRNNNCNHTDKLYAV